MNERLGRNSALTSSSLKPTDIRKGDILTRVCNIEKNGGSIEDFRHLVAMATRQLSYLQVVLFDTSGIIDPVLPCNSDNCL